ncbi:MAG: ribokinase [Lachnospiraceae bacterium]|nr:ribokinase [Lachnospiraceae bacterium]
MREQLHRDEKRKKLLNFGSLNIDYNYSVRHFVQKGETISSNNLQVFSGGKGMNQSIALAKAGVTVYHAGCIGEDGLFLVDELEKVGVNTKYIQMQKDVRTGNAIIQNDSSGDNCIILYGGANQTITKEYVDKVIADFDEQDILILQNEVSEVGYMIQKAMQRRMTIVLNPSPMDEKITTYCLEQIDYLMLNEIEARQILAVEKDCSYETLIDQLVERFPTLRVVLTIGSAGSFYKDNTQTIRQKSYPVKQVDTTSAGDTYTGYFIASLVKGYSESEAMNIASKAAAIAVGKKGAASSIPYYQELENYIFEYCIDSMSMV